MRSRCWPEIFRDSRVGSIVIAQLIAAGLGYLVVAASWPVTLLLSPFINFVVSKGFRADIVPLNGIPYGLGWQYSALLIGEALLRAVLSLAAAYLLSVWVYTPKRRVRVSTLATTEEASNS